MCAWTRARPAAHCAFRRATRRLRLRSRVRSPPFAAFWVLARPPGASLSHYLEASWRDGRAPFDPKELMQPDELRNANPNEVRCVMQQRREALTFT